MQEDIIKNYSKYSFFVLTLSCLMFSDIYAGSSANVTKEDKKAASEVSASAENSKEKKSTNAESAKQNTPDDKKAEKSKAENTDDSAQKTQEQNNNEDAEKKSKEKSENNSSNSVDQKVAQSGETAPISTSSTDLYAQKLTPASQEAITELQSFGANIKEYCEEHKEEPDFAKNLVQYMRDKSNELFVNLGGMKEDLSVVQDLKIGSDGTNYQIPVRLYRNSKKANKNLMIFIHGGCWSQGNLTTHDYLCRKLAKSLPVDVVAIDYRLSPENAYPIPLNDVLSVYKHYASGKDYERFILCGDSAGGNLCAALCIKIKEANLKTPFSLVLMYPVLGNAFESRSYETFKDCIALSKDAALQSIGKYAGKPATEASVLANKLIFPLNENNTEIFPEKNIIITAGYDILLDDQLEFVMKLKTAKKEVLHIIDEGVIHGYMTYGRFFDDLVIQNCEKIREYLFGKTAD